MALNICRLRGHLGVRSRAGAVIQLMRSSEWRRLSTANIQVEQEGEVAMVTMNRPPVNALSADFLREIAEVIDGLEKEKTIRGMILKSAFPKVYSAGLELKDVKNVEKETLYKHFWNLQEVYIRLYGTPLVAVSAISGHAIAGGCLLALCCDYRVITRGSKIGLTEVLLGVQVPYWLKDLAVNCVGLHKAEKMITTGEAYSAEDALTMGLVDHVAAKEDVEAIARQTLEKLLKVPDHGRTLMKEMMRRPSIDALQKIREADAKSFASQVTSTAAQQSISKYLENLKNKNA